MCDLNNADVTHHGLEQWFKRMFEKLGWMVLAANKEGTHYAEKVKQYKEEVNHFLKKVDAKLDEKCTQEKDRRDDLTILKTHASTLKQFLTESNLKVTKSAPESAAAPAPAATPEPAAAPASGGARKRRGSKKGSKSRK